MKNYYYDNKYVVRCGDFIGIYNVEKDKSLTLSKKVNNEYYGFCGSIPYKNEKDKYCVNEYYRIPKGYNLNCILDIMIIHSCINSQKSKLQLKAKNPHLYDKKYKYLLLLLTAYATTSEELRDDPICSWRIKYVSIKFDSVVEAYKYFNKITKHIK